MLCLYYLFSTSGWSLRGSEVSFKRIAAKVFFFLVFSVLELVILIMSTSYCMETVAFIGTLSYLRKKVCLALSYMFGSNLDLYLVTRFPSLKLSTLLFPSFCRHFQSNYCTLTQGSDMLSIQPFVKVQTLTLSLIRIALLNFAGFVGPHIGKNM